MESYHEYNFYKDKRDVFYEKYFFDNYRWKVKVGYGFLWLQERKIKKKKSIETPVKLTLIE